MRIYSFIVCMVLSPGLVVGLDSGPGGPGISAAWAQAGNPAAGAPAEPPVAADPSMAKPVAPAPADIIAEPEKPAVVAGQAADPAALRATCEQALRTDVEWRAALRDQLARSLVGEAPADPGDARWRAEVRGAIARSLIEEAPEPGDAQWRAELKQRLASEVHTEDANLMLRNKRHVVMAYGAIWLLVTLFAFLMWTRQRGLKAELARLEAELGQAMKD